MHMYVKTLFAAVALMFSGLLWAAQVDINRADAQVLAETLNGVGKAKAAAIVEYRKANGPFQSADDLTKVKGIGAATLKKNREKILLGNEEVKQTAE